MAMNQQRDALGHDAAGHEDPVVHPELVRDLGLEQAQMRRLGGGIEIAINVKGIYAAVVAELGQVAEHLGGCLGRMLRLQVDHLQSCCC